MKKSTLLTLFFLSSITLLGCKDKKISTEIIVSSNSSEIYRDNEEVTDNTYQSPPSTNLFVLTENSITTNPFIFKDSTLIFPNWNDNNKISLINFPDKNIKITNNMIGDFLNYSTNSMALFNNSIFFSNENDNNTLYKLNLIDKSINKINSRPVDFITSDLVRIYYIDSKTKELFSYDPLNNIEVKLVNKVGKFLLNGNNIIFQNPEDKYKLYRSSINGNLIEKLTDYSVDSFATLGKNLFFINISDNNHLYKLSTSDLSTRRIALINGSSLATFNNTLFFIDNTDSNKLKSIAIDLENNKYTLKTIISDSINNFYFSEKGLFYRKSIDVNSLYYFIPLS